MQHLLYSKERTILLEIALKRFWEKFFKKVKYSIFASPICRQTTEL